MPAYSRRGSRPNFPKTRPKGSCPRQCIPVHPIQPAQAGGPLAIRTPKRERSRALHSARELQSFGRHPGRFATGGLLVWVDPATSQCSEKRPAEARGFSGHGTEVDPIGNHGDGAKTHQSQSGQFPHRGSFHRRVCSSPKGSSNFRGISHLACPRLCSIATLSGCFTSRHPLCGSFHGGGLPFAARPSKLKAARIA
jgi:hypothetical protein